MKKKHQKFKPLKELYDQGDILLKSKAVDLLKASLEESTIAKSLAAHPSQDKIVETQRPLSSSEVSNIPYTSCQSSFSEDLQSLDSVKTPDHSKDLPMLQHAISSQTAVECQYKDVLNCQGGDSSCISKDDGAVMIISDQVDGEVHKSASFSFPDVLEKSLNVLRATGEAHKSVSSSYPDAVEKPLNVDLSVTGEAHKSVSSSYPDAVEKPLNVDLSVTGEAHKSVSSSYPDAVEKPLYVDLSVTGEAHKSVSSSYPDAVEKPLYVDLSVTGEAHKSVISSCPDAVEKPPNVLSVIDEAHKSISSSYPNATTEDPCLPIQDELEDVSVCDNCGDSGKEALLVLCSKCSDGAEHIYCMTPIMNEVPEGDWICEDCSSIHEPKRPRQAMTETPENASKPSSLQEPSQGSPAMISASHHDGKMKTNHSSKASSISDKRLGLAAKRKRKPSSVDGSVQPLKTSGSGGKSQLSRKPSSTKMTVKKNAERQVSSSFAPAKKMVKQGCSSDHRSSKPEQQSCGGSFNDEQVLDSPDPELELRRLRGVVSQKGRSVKDKANCKQKKNHSDKKVSKSLSLTETSPNPTNASKTQSSDSTIKAVQCGSKRKITEKNYSLDNTTNQASLPFTGSSPTKVSSSRTKVVSKIGKKAGAPIKSVEDKSASQVNENTNVEGSLVLEGNNRVNTSAETVEQRTSPCDSNHAINSPAKNVSADPDLRVSVDTQKAELVNINRNNNDVASSKVQHVEVEPRIDPVNLDSVVPNVTSAIPEDRYMWRGTFSVKKSGKCHTDCYGLQAHLSTCASSKIADLVLDFSKKLLFKEVPRLDTWPIQFETKNPTEQDIDLYFFARDLCSYERSYKLLLEDMTNNDKALETNCGEFQLLVYPSSLLPARSQCWNSMQFLWGVFRRSNVNDSHAPDLNVVTVDQDVYTPVANESDNRFISALISGSSSQPHTSSMHEPEPANPVVLQSLALIETGEQTIDHEVPPLKEHITNQSGLDVLADTVTSVRDWSKEDSGGGVHSHDLQKNDTNSPKKTGIVQSDQVTRGKTAASEFWQGHSVNSFAMDSRPSGSSDGGGCSKSADEPKIDKSSGSEGIDLNLVIAFPILSDYQPETPLVDEREKNVSLALSLGLPGSAS